MRRIDMNQGIELADELAKRLWDESDNASEFTSSIAVAIRRLQSYSDYTLLTLNVPLRRILIHEEGE